MKLIVSFLIITCLGLFTHKVSALAIGDDAPDFSLMSMDQTKVVTLSELKGNVVYLDFWASWCGPCRTSFPILSKLYQDYQTKGFEIVSVNLDEDPKLAEIFLQQHPVTFQHLNGFGTGIDKTYGVHAMPTGIFIDARGKVRLIHKGFKPSHGKFIEAVLQKLIVEI